MARTTDLPYPAPLHDLHAGCDAQGLHVALNFLVESANPDMDVWDTAVWDGTNPDVTWWSDESWVDVAGDVRGLVVTHGRNDLNGQPGASHLTMELDNTTGRYDQWNDQGVIVTSPLGQMVGVWTDTLGWRFWGRVAIWEQDYGSGPNPAARTRQARVTVEAFDSLNLLAQQIDGLTYRLGAEGDTTPARLAYLASVAGFRRGFRFTPGNVSHRDMDSVNPILESMQMAAESDGGVVFVDVDGALTFWDRSTMVAGRPDATQPRAVFADTCQPDVWDFWDGDPITDDAQVKGEVVLTNVDLLQASVKDQTSIDRYGRRVLALQSQTWRTQEDGDALAAWLLDRRRYLFFRVADLTRHSTYPELRLGDRIRYVRTLAGGTRVDVDLIVEGWQWEYAPGVSTLQVSTTPVSALNAYARWDESGDVWDTALWTY